MVFGGGLVLTGIAAVVLLIVLVPAAKTVAEMVISAAERRARARR